MPLASGAGLSWDLLSEAEHARAGAFRREEDARTFCRTRVFLRRVLSRYLEVPPRELRIGQSKAGKPCLLDGANLKFNLSHCPTTALLALTVDDDVGADVEDVQPVPGLARIAQEMLTAEEAGMILVAEEQECLVRFLRAWTRKEAILKALGKGLGLPSGSFSVPLQASGCWTLSDFEPAGHWGRSIMVRDVSRDHVIAAVAGRDVSGRLVERTFRPDESIV